MKRICLFMLVLALVPAFIFADIQSPGPQQTQVELPQGRPIISSRVAPAYTFTKVPTSIIINYYDYMIGAYNSIPLKVIPDAAGGGYFMTYHGRRQAASTRRQFYAYLDAAGNVLNNNEITSVQNHEGFGAMAVDPISGKPMYAWHANADGTVDANLETQFTSDAFIVGIAGLFNDIDVVADAPTTITPPGGPTTTDNEFIWPTVVIGPSPVANKRRVYVGMRNYVSHAMSGNPSENMYIAYTDFNGDDIEMATPLVWNHITIPEMDTWNHTTTDFRRPAGTLATDNAGNLYWAGHHSALDIDSNPILEDDLDVFVCPNYGQGTWTRYSGPGNIATWNPPATPTGTAGYYTDSENGDIPYTNAQLSWGVSNSGHFNVVLDSANKIHVPGIWALNTFNGFYYPALQYVKEYVYDIATHSFEIRDIYPKKDPADTFNATFTPWDLEAPWGVVDEWGGNATEGWYPLMATGWPFPHWDTTAHADAMMFHYNGVRISEPNTHEMMVCVWQDSERARMFNYYSDTDYAAFANTPEIYISVSPNNGGFWSEPIILNNVETPQFAGLKPMYIYPADKVIYVSTNTNGEKIGKIGFLFYDDFTWGSNVNAPAYHPTPDGGQVMFMEMQITFPLGGPGSNDDNTVPQMSNLLHQNYPNPFNPETTISFDMPMAGSANLSIYNVKGQLVKTLVNGSIGNGRQSIVWNGTDASNSAVTSGLYFYRLTTNGHTETRKMMLVK